MQKFKDLPVVKDLFGYYRRGWGVIKNSPFNQKLDKMGYQIQDNFFELVAAKDESLFWRKWSGRIRNTVFCAFLGFALLDLSHLTRDRYWMNPYNVDFIGEYLFNANNIQTRFPIAFDRIVSDAIEKEGMDTLEWLSIGQRFAEIGLAEYAFHAYYMAHLMMPQYIKTNSELQFDTALPPNSNIAKETASLDDILNTLLSDGDGV